MISQPPEHTNHCQKRAQIEEICRKHEVALCCLFGSQKETGTRFLDGGLGPTEAEESDLDVGVVFLEFFPEKNRECYPGLLQELSGVFAPFQVDLVYLEEERCQLQYDALTKGALIYACCDRCSRTYHRRVLEGWGDWYNWWP